MILSRIVHNIKITLKNNEQLIRVVGGVTKFDCKREVDPFLRGRT